MPSSESIEDKSRIVDLLEIYGELLTERQRLFIQQHYADDLSYGEISENMGISRQAVHDAIGHGKRSLERFEAHLKLLDRMSKSEEPSGKEISVSDQVVSDVNIAEARRLAKKACQLVGDDLMYDTSKLKSVIYELVRVLDASNP